MWLFSSFSLREEKFCFLWGPIYQLFSCIDCACGVESKTFCLIQVTKVFLWCFLPEISEFYNFYLRYKSFSDYFCLRCELWITLINECTIYCYGARSSCTSITCWKTYAFTTKLPLCLYQILANHLWVFLILTVYSGTLISLSVFTPMLPCLKSCILIVLLQIIGEENQRIDQIFKTST
jgi:hypothetical protein